MKLKFILASALVAVLGLDASAVRALDKFLSVTQPDGSVLSVKKCGDERSHYLVTSDGALVAQKDGAYYFGTIDNHGAVVATEVLAADPAFRNAAQMAAARIVTPSDAVRIADAPRKERRLTVAQDGMGRFTSNFPRKGDIHGLVILVEYKDYKFQLRDPHEYFSGLLNTDGFSEYNATGCAAEYFRENSNNQFRPVFDVYGPVTLSQNRSYYGGNDYYGQDKNPEEMVVESVKALDPEVDFSIYDMDNNGVIDNVYVIYAGQGEASYGPANSVWPHSWELTKAGKSFKVDGKTVDTYGCSNEWELNRPDGVGTFIHEFSHVMGLPDLYCTSNAGLQCTPGMWSALDYGPYNNDGCTPPNYSTYERLAMGWIDPQVLNGPESVTLENLADTNHACIVQTAKDTEYFLFENRQQKGWDKYLPGHGMLIWHIDFVQSVFDANAVNNTASHQYVEIEKASNVRNAQTETEYAGWAWPGTKKRTEFTDATTPSMKTWTGKSLNLPVTGITEKDGLISFDIAGGAPKILAPEAAIPTSGGEDWFLASWSEVDGAVDYMVTVYESLPGGEQVENKCPMGSDTTFELPEGWTSSHETVYSTTGNYGEAAPSYKMSSDQSWIMSPKYDSDITSVKFWVKGQQAEESKLTVTGVMADGNSIEISTVYPEKTTAKTEEINVIPAGVRQVKLTYTKSKGNVAVDDIVLTTGGASVSVLPGYESRSTSGATSLRVTTPATPGAEYQFTVVASDGENVSKPSNRVVVPYFSENGIDMTETATGLTVSGRVVTSDGVVSVTDLSGRMLFSGKGVYQLPEQGVYIVKAGSMVRKVSVR